MTGNRILIDYLFRLIEKNDLEGVKALFNRYPDLKKDKKNLRAQNGWGPDLFSARFGYTDMLKFFFSEIYENRTTKITDLILLNIHSGSLKTMYFLQNPNKEFRPNDLRHYYINSCKLDKLKLSLYFLLRGAYMMDNHASSNNQNNDTTAQTKTQNRYHNIYIFKPKDSEENCFYDMKDKIIDKKNIIETTLRDVSLNLRIVKNFIMFNKRMLEVMEKKKIKQYENDQNQARWYKILNIIKSNAYLNKKLNYYL